MDAAERRQVVQRLFPPHLVPKFVQRGPLPFLQNRKRFDDAVMQGGKEIRRPFPRRDQRILREITMVSALLDNCEIAGLAHHFPYLGELGREEPAKERPDACVCEIVAAPANLAPS